MSPFNASIVVDLGAYGVNGYTTKKRDLIPLIQPELNHTTIGALANTVDDYDFVIHTPLMWLDKAQTWELADQLGKFEYVREHTLTCYRGIKGNGCGTCPACELRQRGLETYLARKGEGK